MFTDKVKIAVKAGCGGDGKVSFHTEKYVPNGGPDGGDGGKGGDIIFIADSSKNTLNDFYYKKHFRAENGEKGGTRKCYGKSGEDLVITVPCGTVIKDFLTGKIIADLFKEGEPYTLLKGGRGGKGNTHFKNSRRQAPAFCQTGEKTTEREIVLELLTIADVGFVGFPNAGKSTLLSVISSAKPKIAAYPFTTLNPNLGVVKHYDDTILFADIPGLIEGASEGAGLGLRFLRHIERTRLIVHVLDIGASEGRDPLDDFTKINAELKAYSEVLAKLPQIVAANKMDLPDAEENLKRFKKKHPKLTVIPITAIVGEGTKELVAKCFEAVKNLPPLAPLEYEPFEYVEEGEEGFEVFNRGQNIFEITGGLIEKLARRVVFDDADSISYFHRMLKDRGVFKALKKAGAETGDTVLIRDLEFDFVE